MATTSRSERMRTMRRDAWWVQPAVTVLVLGAFVGYATFRTFENAYFLTEISKETRALWLEGKVGHLLSPFYSPLFITDWRIFGFHISPALFILPFPLSFRLTCYYYRKAYYRSFFWSPPACAVKGTTKENYTGESRLPLLVQNFHRYAFYFAFALIFILAWDVVKSMQYKNGMGISVGTLVLLINVVLLAGYTFGCHSFRHLIGGGVDCYSCSAANRTRYGLWRKVTFLNERHALYAWMSLFSVGLADLYVRLVCSGMLTDYVLIRF